MGIEVNVDQVRFWNELWNDIDEKLRVRVRLAWAMITYPDECTAWKKVAGPMGATDLTLRRLDWKPEGPDAARSAEEVKCEFGKGHNKHMEDLLRRQATKGLWVQASKHYGGEGLQDGGDMSAARRLHIKYIKDKCYKEAAIVEAMVNGSCWFRDRFNRADPRISDTCDRCKAMEETAFHAIWSVMCPKIGRASGT